MTASGKKQTTPMRKRTRIMAAVLHTCIFLLGFGMARAQPHMPPEVDELSVSTPDMDVWLRRLPGRFVVEGAAIPEGCGVSPPICSNVKGAVDCIGIGTGPGVQCILNVTWPDNWDMRGNPIFLSYLDPSMILFGMDPGKNSISMLRVDNKGLPEGGPGFISGNMAKVVNRCVNAGATCERITRIEARSDSSLVYIWISTRNLVTRKESLNLMLSLRRETPVEGGKAPAGPSAEARIVQ
jgi:hypothetical protein